MKNTKILNKVYIVTKTLCFDRKTITTFFSNEFYTTVELAKLAVHNKESIIYKTRYLVAYKDGKGWKRNNTLTMLCEDTIVYEILTIKKSKLNTQI